MYLIQSYAWHKNMNPNDVFEKLKSKNLYKFVLNSYEVYHIECLENAFDELDQLLTAGKIT